jgi:Zn-dependent metalloprotease
MKRSFIFTLVLVVCCLMVTSSWAARKVDITSANAKGYIGQLNQGVAMGRALGLEADEGFQLLRQSTDFNGVTHTRYQQTFKGIPIWGMQAVVSKGRGGEVVRLNGNIVQGAPREVGAIPANLNAQAALSRMKAGFAGQIFSSETAGTYIYLHNGNARLCDVVSFFTDDDCGNPSRPVFFIDAKSGKVLHSFDSLTYAYEGTGPGGNPKVGYYTYGPGGDYPGFGVAVVGSVCTMNYADCTTVDLNHTTSGTTPFSYTCYNNTHEFINEGACPMNDAQFFGQAVYNMFQAWYGVPVLPFQLMMRCHYSNNYENAFWNGSSMTFGDGYTTFYPLVALDVSAHEVAHGFTENYSGLIYSSQSGGINESYSDLAGEAAKFYMRGTNDFMCGYDIFKAAGQALRYLCDPTADGRSIDHISQYYEGLDVHYSSGLFNKAFCEIATSTGWTTRMAFDIFTRANMIYWVPSSTFQQGAEDVLQAAADYGYNEQDVINGFAVVGINLVPPEPVDMYVKDITQTISRRGRNYSSSAVVTIWDINNAPVADATVYVTWSGVVSGSTSGITGSNGTVTFKSSSVRSTGPFTITVTNVTHAVNTYIPALNVETSDTDSY